MKLLRSMTRTMLVLTALGGMTFITTDAVRAYGGAHACPGGTSDWQGTQLGPAAPVVVTGEAAITCPSPQVTVTAGTTQHSQTSAPSVQNGQPCYEYDNSSVSIAPVVNGQRQVTWYSPNNSAMYTTTIPDRPFAGIPGYIPAEASVLYASLIMGSATMTVHYELDGKWSTVTNSCQGAWTVPANGSTDGFPVASVTRRGPLTYQSPPALNVEQLVASATAKFRQVYTAGQVTSTPPATGQIVHYPACFSERGANVPPVVGFSIRDPQAGAGAVLVVNYVVQATVDETWWDFAEPENPVTVQYGLPPSGACAVQHTYSHVSADAYASDAVHHPPPTVVWTFGNAEPAPDMEAVEAWQHVHLSVTAYYQQPDGSQYAEELPVSGADDFWLAASPEWIRVNQIESVPVTNT